MRRILFPILLLTGLTLAGDPAPTAAGLVFVPAKDVLAHLERTIAWYQRLGAFGVPNGSASDVLLRDNIHQLALRSLQLGFDFAKADAAVRAAAREAADPGAESNAEGHNIEQVAAAAAKRVTDAEKRISDLDSSSPGQAGSRATRAAQRQELEAELNLAKEIQKTVGSMVSFAGATGSGGVMGGGLLGQINDLEKSVPEARQSPPGAKAPSQPAARQSSPPPSNADSGSEGMVSMAGEVFSDSGAQTELENLIAQTDALTKSIDQLKLPLLTSLRASIARSEALAGSVASEDLPTLMAGQKEIDQLTGRFKELSTVLVPLGEQQIVVGSVRGNLQEWRNELKTRNQAATHSLLLRVGGLAVAIFFILVVSEIWRRATLRYVSDARRRRQFLVIRRVAVGFAITIMVVLAFVTEFGSVATYAGFLTAGLALALQNVILSVVAYFFLIGRYGVRVGDRVTISGVTGEVIDLGLVRIYMMELGGTGPELHPTGRVVVYSNSVLFQPAAIFKQMPGTNYAWRAVELTLSPETDFQLAEQKLTAAVNGVYEQYREVIEKQHAKLERSVELQFQSPKPDCHLRFNDTGLEFVARYPVELGRAREIDERVMKALYETISKEPQLTLAPAGAPKMREA